MLIDIGKEQRWQDMYVHFSQVTDKLDMGIDRGILDTVIVLNLLGMPTIMSCEGHIDDSSGAPWVDIEDPEANQQTDSIGRLFKEAQIAYAQGLAAQDLFHRAHEARLEALTKHLTHRATLLRYLATFYEHRQVPYDVRLVVQSKSAGRTRLESQGASLQEIASPERRAQKLAEYQNEMHAFTAFLKELFFTQG